MTDPAQEPDTAPAPLVEAAEISPLPSDDPNQPAPSTDNGPRPDDGAQPDQPVDGELAGQDSL